MSMTVVGVFDDAQEAKEAVDKLVSAGYMRNTVDVSPYTGASNTSDRYDDHDHDSGIGNFFRNLFGDDDDDANRYSAMGSSRSIVTIHATSQDQADKAADILDDCGAIDVRDTADQYGYADRTTGMGMDLDTDVNRTTGMGTDMDMDTDVNRATGMGMDMDTDVNRATGMGMDTDADQKVEIIEENLEVGKRTVETGGVRLKSRIVSRPVEESIRLREERVTVNRTPVNRAATTGELDAFKEGEVVMTEHAEKAVVSKTAQVVEEVSVGKTVEEREEKIHDTVRKTEVDVEQIPGEETRTDNMPPKNY